MNGCLIFKDSCYNRTDTSRKLVWRITSEQIVSTTNSKNIIAEGNKIRSFNWNTYYKKNPMIAKGKAK